MNITFLLRLWPVYGGGETVTICLANEMARRGWNVSILYFKEHTRSDLPFIDPRINSIRITGIDCDEFTPDKRSLPGAQHAREFLQDYITQYNIDFIINQWWPYSYIQGIKKHGKAKIITCLHQAFYTPIIQESNTLKRLAKKIFQRYYLANLKKRRVNHVKEYLPHVDKYIFLSPSFQQQFEDFAQFENNPPILDAIPNPLVYNESFKPDDYEKKENIVLLVGRMLEGQKRITRAIRAWSIIEQQTTASDWRFVIVGEGPDLNKYKQLACRLNLRRISFEGFQNPLSYYRRAKLFAMTSAFEGFGMTLVEAQQNMVVPVVMDSYLSLHDIMTNNVNGMITPNGDIKHFAHALTSLINDPHKTKELALQGLISSQKFAVEKIVDRWEQLFSNM